MSRDANRIYIPSKHGDGHALRQGKIISKLIQANLNAAALRTSEGHELIVDQMTHPFAIVVSQDCDLESDYRARASGNTQSPALLPSVLMCQITTAVELRGREDINKGIWDRVKINKDERYHFFQSALPDQDGLEEGLPELGADFKRYFTVPTEELYCRLAAGTQRRAILASPYLEHFSFRFHCFMCRIALPEDHFSEPASIR